MGIVIIQAVFTIINIVAAAYNYKAENHKLAILNGFVAGFCFFAFIVKLLDCED